MCCFLFALAPRLSSRHPAGSIRQQDSQVAQIVARGARDDCVAENVEKRISIKARQGCGGIEAASFGAFQRGSVNHRARCQAVAVDPIGSRAKNSNVLARDFSRTGQGEMLIAAANASIRNFDRDLAARDQTNAGSSLPELTEAREQML